MPQVHAVAAVLCDQVYVDRGKVSLLGTGWTQVSAVTERVTAYVIVQFDWPSSPERLEAALEVWRHNDYKSIDRGDYPSGDGAKPRALRATTLELDAPEKDPGGLPAAQIGFAIDVGIELEPGTDYVVVVKVGEVDRAWVPFTAVAR